jgi:hypothetical protein
VVRGREAIYFFFFFRVGGVGGTRNFFKPRHGSVVAVLCYDHQPNGRAGAAEL